MLNVSGPNYDLLRKILAGNTKAKRVWHAEASLIYKLILLLRTALFDEKYLWEKVLFFHKSLKYFP